MRIALTLDSDEVPGKTADYVRALVDAGFRRGEVVLLPPGQPVTGSFDGLVLGGGVDVDPEKYGQTVRPDARVAVDPERDATDFALFEKARRDSTPVLGICRGLQVINVAMGGTLVQDIPSQRPSKVVHLVPHKENERLDHSVEVKPGTTLAGIAAASEIRVNSRHHQAIDRVAPGLRVAAVAPDGLVEAVESENPWLLAVQWHPENLLKDPVSRRLFDEFARAVRGRAGEGILRPPDLLTRA